MPPITKKRKVPIRSIKNETWKYIPDYIGYELSSLGRVKKLNIKNGKYYEIKGSQVDKGTLIRIYGKPTFLVHTKLSELFPR